MERHRAEGTIEILEDYVKTKPKISSVREITDIARAVEEDSRDFSDLPRLLSAVHDFETVYRTHRISERLTGKGRQDILDNILYLYPEYERMYKIMDDFLSLPQRQSILDYTYRSSRYTGITKRKGFENENFYNRDNVITILDLMARLPSDDEAHVVYRGVKRKYSVGDRVEVNQILSTSIRMDVADIFAKTVSYFDGEDGYILELHVSPGDHVTIPIFNISNYRNQYEVLLPPGIMLVKNINKSNGRFLVCDYIPYSRSQVSKFADDLAVENQINPPPKDYLYENEDMIKDLINTVGSIFPEEVAKSMRFVFEDEKGNLVTPKIIFAKYELSREAIATVIFTVTSFFEERGVNVVGKVGKNPYTPTTSVGEEGFPGTMIEFTLDSDLDCENINEVMDDDKVPYLTGETRRYPKDEFYENRNVMEYLQLCETRPTKLEVRVFMNRINEGAFKFLDPYTREIITRDEIDPVLERLKSDGLI